MQNEQKIIDVLDNLQDEVKEISQALVTLARIEERQHHANKAIEKMHGTLEKYEARIVELEVKSSNQLTMAALWSALVVAGGIIGYLFNKLA